MQDCIDSMSFKSPDKQPFAPCLIDSVVALLEYVMLSHITPISHHKMFPRQFRWDLTLHQEKHFSQGTHVY